jgi:hypothetical protein
MLSVKQHDDLHNFLRFLRSLIIPEKPIKKSIFGTMIGKRRQSIHGGFTRATSPSKGGSGSGSGPTFPRLSSFTRSSSRDGRPGPSPRASSGNLRSSPAPESSLAPLPESPKSQTTGTNGVNPAALITDTLASTSNGVNGITSPDISDVQPPAGPPPSFLKPENRKDSDGFTVPAAMNDPISQAQLEAVQQADQQQFKVDIKNEPIPEQDADAEAALSNVANTLRSQSMSNTLNRRAGTVRGRRDVRNTIYVPSGSFDLGTSEINPVPSQSLGAGTGRAAALATLSSGESNTVPSVSDATSIRSGHSLATNPVVKHADMHNPGLNASIIETINATYENGEVKTSKISGEVALIYNKSDPSDTLPGMLFQFKLCRPII